MRGVLVAYTRLLEQSKWRERQDFSSERSAL